MYCNHCKKLDEMTRKSALAFFIALIVIGLLLLQPCAVGATEQEEPLLGETPPVLLALSNTILRHAEEQSAFLEKTGFSGLMESFGNITTHSLRLTFEGLGEISDPDMREMAMYASLFSGTGLNVDVVADKENLQMSATASVNFGPTPYLNGNAYFTGEDLLVSLPEIYPPSVFGFRGETLGESLLASGILDNATIDETLQGQITQMHISAPAEPGSEEMPSSMPFSQILSEQSFSDILVKTYDLFTKITYASLGEGKHAVNGRALVTDDYMLTVRTQDLHNYVRGGLESLYYDPMFKSVFATQMDAIAQSANSAAMYEESASPSATGSTVQSGMDYDSIVEEILTEVDESFAQIATETLTVTLYVHDGYIAGGIMPLMFKDGQSLSCQLQLGSETGLADAYTFQMSGSEPDQNLTMVYNSNMGTNEGVYEWQITMRSGNEDLMRFEASWDTTETAGNLSLRAFANTDEYSFSDALPMFEIIGDLHVAPGSFTLRIGKLTASSLGMEIFTDISYSIENGGEVDIFTGPVYYPLEDTPENQQNFFDTLSQNVSMMLYGALGMSGDTDMILE